jgi:hypothetical protein
MANLFDQTLLGRIGTPVKRKAYFAFHFDDIMRVNNVRNAWKITHPDNALNRSFYDSSLWESKKLEGDDALRRLIRDGVGYTSAVCVLVGTDTWSRQWVKYEIARSVIDSRGLLAVHINGINHHLRRTPDQLGYNPLQIIGVYGAPNGQFYLYEKRYVLLNALTNQGAVPLPKYLPSPQVGYVTPLSYHTAEYNYVLNEGHKKIGSWIDAAAQAAGR